MRQWRQHHCVSTSGQFFLMPEEERCAVLVNVSCVISSDIRLFHLLHRDIGVILPDALFHRVDLLSVNFLMVR